MLKLLPLYSNLPLFCSVCPLSLSLSLSLCPYSLFFFPVWPSLSLSFFLSLFLFLFLFLSLSLSLLFTLDCQHEAHGMRRIRDSKASEATAVTASYQILKQSTPSHIKGNANLVPQAVISFFFFLSFCVWVYIYVCICVCSFFSWAIWLYEWKGECNEDWWLNERPVHIHCTN